MDQMRTNAGKLPTQLANVNYSKMPNAWRTKQLAGKNWLLSSRNKYSELTLRKPDACSLARATAFNRTHIERYYNYFEDLIKRSSALTDGTRICKLDETSTTTVQNPQKVIAR